MAFINNNTTIRLPILKHKDQFFMTELANLSLGSHTKIPPPSLMQQQMPLLLPLRLMGIILNKRPHTQPFTFNNSLHNNNYINNKLNSSAFRDLRRPPPPHLLRRQLIIIPIRISRQ